MGVTSRLAIIVAASALLWLAPSTPASGADDFPAAVESLAAKCDELGLAEQAAFTRRWIIPRHPGRQYLVLPPPTDLPWPKANAGQLVQFWHGRFKDLRQAQAANLFAEAKSLAAEQPALAYQRLHEVLREDPDHAEARRILDYEKNSAGKWLPRGASRLDADVARLNHPQLGWRAGSYWKLDTPHFAIVTNHSAREALEAGQQLENLHALWRQIFFRYWSNSAALTARFAGGNEPLAPTRPRMKVVLFKKREEYVAQLSPAEPKIGLTLGIYMDKQRTAYFYAGDTSVYPTWYHEATHQLFQEGVPGTAADPAAEQNFWAVEGAALYMESLADHGGFWTAGGWEADRLQFARYRGLSRDFLLPTADLAALGREKIQASPEIRKLYAQAAGLAQFLIDGEKGQHREPFVDLLTAIYAGIDQLDTLVKTTGQPFGELDAGYLRFLNVTDADLAGIPDPTRVRNLSLGRTEVTDKGLAALAGCKKLEWLDLSLTAAGDQSLPHFSAATGLKQLFLEGTKITDASLPLIAGFKQLEELDLSKLPLSDAGLAPLAGMKSLKVLYLSGSPITDAGLVHMRNLKNLETLETTGTKITPEGLKKLQASLPKLN
ncbi:MAG: hypothetical protein SFU86_10305 [Pirellulaceae bacterium]|nr:hypothetical protein [Pirellulaceae bacterium]